MLLLASPDGIAVNKPPSNGSVTVTDVRGVLPWLVTVKVYVTVSTDAVEHPLVSTSLNTPAFVIAIASKQASGTIVTVGISSLTVAPDRSVTNPFTPVPLAVAWLVILPVSISDCVTT